jgi:hypothetical protein
MARNPENFVTAQAFIYCSPVHPEEDGTNHGKHVGGVTAHRNSGSSSSGQWHIMGGGARP